MSDPTPTRPSLGARLWPIAIIGVLVLTVGANGYLLYRAKDAPMPLERDYYRKAVSWDSTMAQAVRNAALGWRLDASVDIGGRLEARLSDSTGHPISDAGLSVEGFPIAFGDGDIQERLAAEGTGYTATLPLRHPGLYELRFEATRGDDRFTTTLRGTPGSSFGAPR